MNEKNSITHEDAKLDERKREILESAKKIFARNGFRRTQVEMIADELGIGKGTVYRHFGSKKSLFVAVANYSMQKLVEHIEFRIDYNEALPERMATAIAAHLEFFDANPDVVEILLQERTEFREEFRPTYVIYRDAYMGHTEEVIRGGIKEGILRDVKDVKGMAVILADIIYGSVMSGYMRGEKHLVDSAGLLAQMIMCGMLSPEAQEGVIEKDLPNSNILKEKNC